jgi:hypothetical protein
MSSTIQINQLLMEREDRLVELFDLERQITAILGQPYPLAPPADLPSLQKRKKARKQPATRTTARIRLRKLDPDRETAYRITYLENSTEKIEIHFDARPLALLINTPLPNLEVLRVETVQPDAKGLWTPVDVLEDWTGEKQNDASPEGSQQ